MKKITLILSLFILALSLLTFLLHTATADYTKWGLPEGAKARLGKGEINDITCTQDGTLLAVADTIGIWIYDFQTGEELSLLTGHIGAINRVAFSPDGRTLASGSDDSTVRLWDMSTWTEIGRLEGHTAAVKSVVFSPDARTLVSRGDDNALRLWNVDTQTQIYTLEEYTGTVESISFSPDGQILAMGGKDDMVRLWDIVMRAEIGKLEGHTGYVSSVSFSPDGHTLASGSHDTTVRLWNVTMWTEIGKLEGHINRVNCVSFSPDGKTLASGGNKYDALWDHPGGDLRLWDVDTLTGIGIHESSRNSFYGVSFSPDGRIIAYKYRSDSDAAGFLDVNTQTKIDVRVRSDYGLDHARPAHTWDVLWVVAAQVKKRGYTWYSKMLQEHIDDPVHSVSFSPDGKTIAASDGYYDPHYSRYIRMWDVATLTEIDTRTYPFGDSRYRGSRSFGNESVSFSPDGKTILSRCEQSVICLRDAATYTEIRRLEISRLGNLSSNTFVFSPDGHTLAIGVSPYTEIVLLWDVTTDTEIGILWGHIGVVQSVSFSPDGRTLASAGSIDGTIRLWDMDTLTEIAILRGHTGWVNSVLFSPDGKTIVSASNDHTVRLWDVDTRTEIAKLEGHTDAVNSVSFNPDGKTIVSGSNDTTVRLWDVATRTGMGILTGHHPYAVNSVSFSPGGKTIASGSDDGTVLLWNITSADHGNTLIEATSLPLEGSLTAKIDPGNDVDYFNVQIEEFGQLTLWTTTTEPLNTIGTLQDSAGVTLATNADKNRDAELNFRIEQYMYPGAYYIKVQSYEHKTGDYTIYATFAPAKDVNGDGVVSVIDLLLVAENYGLSEATPAQGDVNGDGEVNREDVIIVLDALDAAAAAPASVFTTESLQLWIDQAKQRNLTDARFQKGIAVLQNLLTMLRETEAAPKATALLANYPNPFNPETWVPYQLAKPAKVTLKIYAADGKLVRLLDLGHQDVGMYHSRNRAAYWDGKNAQGERLASGIYFYTLTAGEYTSTRKMLIQK